MKILVFLMILGLCACQLEVELKQDVLTLVQDLADGDKDKFEADLHAEIQKVMELVLQNKDVQPLLELEADLNDVVQDFHDDKLFPALLELKQILTVDLQKAVAAIDQLDSNVKSFVDKQKSILEPDQFQVIQKPPVQSKFCCAVMTTDPNYKNPCKPGQMNICL